MTFPDLSHSSLYHSLPSFRDEDEYQKLIATTKATLKTGFLTREQSDALDQAIYTLTCNCFKESNNLCETPDDVSKMFSKVLSTFSFEHIIYSKSSNSQLTHLSLTIEKQQPGFGRIIDFFWRMVYQKKSCWYRYEFSSSFQASSQSSTDDYYQLKIFNNSKRKASFFEPPKLPTSISEIILELGNSQSYDIVDPSSIPEIILELGNSQSYDIVDPSSIPEIILELGNSQSYAIVDPSSIPEEPSLPLTLGQRLSRLNLKERLSTFTTGVGELFSSSNSAKSE